MRILIYGLNFAPELTGIGKYTGEMATWLAHRGHEVRVVTGQPYYPAWRIHEDYRGRSYCTEHAPNEPTIYRTPLYVPQRPTGLQRILHLFSFMIASIPLMLREMFRRPDLVFTIEPTFFCAPLALLVAKTAGAPCWLHVQDFEVDAAFNLGLLPADGIIQKVSLELERFFTLGFDRVSSISAKMLERSCSKGVPAARTVLFPNWVDVDAIHPICPAHTSQNAIRRELATSVQGIQCKIILLYSGNMGAKQGLEVLAPLARAFGLGGEHENSRVHFLFCGDGVFRSDLEGLVADHANVTVMPLLPLDRLNDLLNAADIHLLPQRADAADLVMPSRLTGMLASGRPVIAVANPGTQVALVVQGRGIVVPAEEAAAFHEAVALLVRDEPMRLSLGREARRYAIRNLSREQVLEPFEAELKGLLAQSKARPRTKKELVNPDPTCLTR